MRYALVPSGLLAIALAACAQTPPPATPTGPCRVDEALRIRFTGLKFAGDMREEIQARSNSRIVRVLRPDDAATMDLRPDRLNVMVDDGGRIEGFRCG